MIIRFNNGNNEYEIMPFSESGYEPFDNELGSFLAEVTLTKFDKDGMNALYQRTCNKRFYFDSLGNLYDDKNAKKFLFNFKNKSGW